MEKQVNLDVTQTQRKDAWAVKGSGCHSSASQYSGRWNNAIALPTGDRSEIWISTATILSDHDWCPHIKVGPKRLDYHVITRLLVA